MSDADREFGGVALFNPQLLAKGELIHDFVVRIAELESLLADLRSRADATPQHHLVLGPAGMGKTTLLHRIAYAIEDDAELGEAYLPLLFPPEQPNVRNLGDLWLNCLNALSDTLARWGRAAESIAIDEIVDALPRDAAVELEVRGRAALLGEAQRLGRRLVLLIDGADGVLERIGDEDWSFRDVLQQSADLVVVAASSAAPAATYTYGAAFYDFFNLVRLPGLDLGEARTLLLTLADRLADAPVRRLIEEHTERIEPIRSLSGGNPRTIAALFETLRLDARETLLGDLETLLDRHTPKFEAQFHGLSGQAQTVVDAVCRRWDPAIAADIAGDTGLTVNTVSAQLDRLVSAGVVERVASVDLATGLASKRHAFQVTERLFNIWYLLRGGGRTRRRLVEFAHFLHAFHGPRTIQTAAGRKLVAAARKPPTIPADLPMELLQTIEAADAMVLAERLVFVPSVAAGIAGQVREHLDAAGLTDRWRPAREALNAVDLGTPDVLEALAPEVRAPALALYDAWLEAASAEPD